MLSDLNPMRDPLKHQQVTARFLDRHTSKMESNFRQWASESGLPLEHSGSGTLWIGRHNPDFRVVGQKKVLELTQKECFVGFRKSRNIPSYAIPTIGHYEAKGWKCLVVFMKDRARPTEALKAKILDFTSKGNRWSGVWNYGQFVPFR